MKQSFEEQVSDILDLVYEEGVKDSGYSNEKSMDAGEALAAITRLHQEEVAESKDLLETTIKYKSNYIGQLEAQVAELQKELADCRELSELRFKSEQRYAWGSLELERTIAELTAQGARYREALEKIAKETHSHPPHYCDYRVLFEAMVQRAKAALAPTPTKGAGV
jgi:hypothetical protein